jgi:hypothetical protein
MRKYVRPGIVQGVVQIENPGFAEGGHDAMRWGRDRSGADAQARLRVKQTGCVDDNATPPFDSGLATASQWLRISVPTP